jgi:outer membrane lipoprotein-sorting protein
MFFMMQTCRVFAAESTKGGVAQPQDLPVFLQNIGKKASNFKTLKTEFTQEKKMVMFKEKLILKGRIFLEKPNKIAWHVDSPVRYSVLITDKLIRQWDEDTNKVQEVSLAKNPIFQNVLSQLTVWFSGEYGSLLDTNEVRIIKRDPLVIEFIPRENNVSKKVIKNITITFRDDQNYLQQLRIQEMSGDVTTINFINTILNIPLDSKSFEVKGRV